MSIRAERTAATRRRIAAAALEQVAEAGYASAAVTAVAARAGVAAGSVYTHFPSKADLFAEVFRESSDRELEIVREIAHDETRPVAERLASAVETWSRRALAAPTLGWALMGEPVDPAVEAERLASKRAYRDVLAALLREGAEDGELPALDAAVAAAAIVGALQEALLGPLAAPPGPEHTHDALIASLVAFVLAAVHAAQEPSWQ